MIAFLAICLVAVSAGFIVLLVCSVRADESLSSKLKSKDSIITEQRIVITELEARVEELVKNNKAINQTINRAYAEMSEANARSEELQSLIENLAIDAGVGIRAE